MTVDSNQINPAKRSTIFIPRTCFFSQGQGLRSTYMTRENNTSDEPQRDIGLR